MIDASELILETEIIGAILGQDQRQHDCCTGSCSAEYIPLVLLAKLCRKPMYTLNLKADT